MGGKAAANKTEFSQPNIMEQKLLEIITQKSTTSNNTLSVGVAAPGHLALTHLKQTLWLSQEHLDQRVCRLKLQNRKN